MKSVYIILLHYKNFYHTDFCLTSINSLTYGNVKVLIVDNNSENDSFKRIIDKYPQHIYLQNEENLGFSRGNNVAIRRALDLGADYIYILNNDVELTPSCLQPMLDVFSKFPLTGIVTNKIMFRGNRKIIWQAGGYIDHKTVMGISRGLNEVDEGQYEKEEETGWASGASSLVKREVFERIGLLPEEYFFGQEEWDFSTHCIKAGYKIIYTPHSVVYHDVGASTKRRPSISIYLGHINKLIYARKYLTPLSFFIFFIKFFIYILFVFKGRLSKTGKDQSLYYRKSARYAGLLAIRDFVKKKFVTIEHLDEIEEKIKRRYHKYVAPE